MKPHENNTPKLSTGSNNMLRLNRFRHVKSRYLSTTRTRSNSNDSLIDNKQYKYMSLKDLGDEFYRLAIKNRDDVIYDLHKEICKKYEETQAEQFQIITELQLDCASNQRENKK
uniref:Uncharacterized protein n=1 Tax=Cacopsylla melanoneura TaxID=428564 RepID=A0A8D9BEX3_9HEMI